MKRSLALSLAIAAFAAAPAAAQDYGVEAFTACSADAFGNVIATTNCTLRLAEDLTDGGQLASLPRCARSAAMRIATNPGFKSILASGSCVEVWSGSDIPIIEIGR